jgi:hypothetical protein
MAALDPAIQLFASVTLDGRLRGGHDEEGFFCGMNAYGRGAESACLMPQAQIGIPGAASQAHALAVAMHCDVDAARGIVLRVKEAPSVAVRPDAAQVRALRHAARRRGAGGADRNGISTAGIVRVASRPFTLAGGISYDPAPTPRACQTLASCFGSGHGPNAQCYGQSQPKTSRARTQHIE